MGDAFARNLRALRESKGLTQTALADAIGVTNASVSLWETKGTVPRAGGLEALCRELDCTERDLLGYADGYWSRSRSPSTLDAAAASTPVPVLGRTHMGDAMDEEPCGLEVQVPADVAAAHPGCFLVHAEGGCMDNRYPADSYLLVDPGMEPFNGCAVLAEVGAASVVRVYMRGASTVMLCCDSHSTQCPDVVAGPDDEPVLLKGVVVWYQADGDVRGA